MGILANEIAIEGGNYQIANSLRFQSASSQNLTRTPASTTNRRTWTLSFWMKRGALSTIQGLFCGNNTTTNGQSITFFNIESDDRLHLQSGVLGTSNAFWLKTTAVFRDPSAWYHVVLKFDSTQATASDRVLIYINGISTPLELDNTAGNTVIYPPLNYDTVVNTTNTSAIGASQGSTAGLKYLDGYMTEVNFIDGQALTPSSFGTTDTTSGQWVAKKYTGTYGTNGFYLPFSNGTSTTTLGADSSGNGNNWTLTNFTRSAGVSDCWMYDVPSGNGGNYPVLNPLDKGTVIGNANLNLGSSTASTITRSTFGVSSGKWYFECTQLATAEVLIGVANASASLTQYLGQNANGWGYDSANGSKYNNGSGTAYGATWTTNDVIGVALDMDAGTLVFYKNNVSQGTAVTGLTGLLFPTISAGAVSTSAAINFGQRSFAYTPPSGFKALCTANLPVATIKQGNKYMDATLYTGNISTNNIVNAGGFKPDLVWTKRRNLTADHQLIDSVRGITNSLISNTTGAETAAQGQLVSINSNGFTLGANPYVNSNGDSFVGWQWQAGQGTTSSNTNGSITSTVSVNATAGFSVVTYTGNGTSGATIGHGLGVAPKMIIVKNRTNTVAGNGNWPVYHTATGNTNYTLLNTTAASTAGSAFWNNTSPTSTVFTVGNTGTVNDSGFNYVAYCFAEIAGYSKFGSYTGNGSADGPFVYLGFRPKYVLIKRTDSSTNGNWSVMDSSVNTYNVATNILTPNTADAESSQNWLDLLSNGFKVRYNSANQQINANGGTYIYMAFAENPFAQANAR